MLENCVFYTLRMYEFLHNRVKMRKPRNEHFSTAVPQKANIVLHRGEQQLRADFVAKVAEEESGRWRRAKLSLPLAGESGGGDYSTDSNATWRDLTLTPRMRPRAEAAVPRTWPTCGGSERWLPA